MPGAAGYPHLPYFPSNPQPSPPNPPPYPRHYESFVGWVTPYRVTYRWLSPHRHCEPLRNNPEPNLKTTQPPAPTLLPKNPSCPAQPGIHAFLTSPQPPHRRHQPPPNPVIASPCEAIHLSCPRHAGRLTRHTHLHPSSCPAQPGIHAFLTSPQPPNRRHQPPPTPRHCEPLRSNPSFLSPPRRPPDPAYASTRLVMPGAAGYPRLPCLPEQPMPATPNRPTRQPTPASLIATQLPVRIPRSHQPPTLKHQRIDTDDPMTPAPSAPPATAASPTQHPPPPAAVPHYRETAQSAASASQAPGPVSPRYPPPSSSAKRFPG